MIDGQIDSLAVAGGLLKLLASAIRSRGLARMVLVLQGLALNFVKPKSPTLTQLEFAPLICTALQNRKKRSWCKWG
jgi:hypothetical protein